MQLLLPLNIMTSAFSHDERDRLGVRIEEDKELRWLLVNFTASVAKDWVETTEGQPGLEAWRKLRSECDPETGARGQIALQQLIGPSQCKDYMELKKKLRIWDQARLNEIK